MTLIFMIILVIFCLEISVTGSLLFRSLVESPGDLTKNYIADDLD